MRLATEVHAKQSVTSWIQTLVTDCFYSRVQLWCQVGQMLKYNWWLLRSGVYHLLPACPVYIEVTINFLASVCLLPYFLKHSCIFVATKTIQHTYSTGQFSIHLAGTSWCLQNYKVHCVYSFNRICTAFACLYKFNLICSNDTFVLKYTRRSESCAVSLGTSLAVLSNM